MVLPRAPGAWVLAEPKTPPFSEQGPGEVLPSSRLHRLLLFGFVSLSPRSLGIAAWVGGCSRSILSTP